MPFCLTCWTELDAEPRPEVCQRCGASAGTVLKQDPLIGRALSPHLELTARLGQGGMAFVYQGRDARLGRDVAVKILLPEYAHTRVADRFLDEARLASQLNSPYTVRVFEQGKDDDIAFLVMELLKGAQLDEVPPRTREAEAGFIREMLLQIGQALDEAHQLNIVHRDIKPGNIFVLGRRARPHFKLLDFGVARAFDGQNTDAGRHTRTGLTVGTPGYMSPEQITGSRDLDGRSDLYSLGLVAWRMLAHEEPFTGATTREVLAARLITDPPPLADFVDTDVVPEALCAIIDDLLRHDRAARIPSAPDLLDRLEALPVWSTDIAPPVEPSEPGSAPAQDSMTEPTVAMAQAPPAVPSVADGFKGITAETLPAAAGAPAIIMSRSTPPERPIQDEDPLDAEDETPWASLEVRGMLAEVKRSRRWPLGPVASVVLLAMVGLALWGWAYAVSDPTPTVLGTETAETTKTPASPPAIGTDGARAQPVPLPRARIVEGALATARLRLAHSPVRPEATGRTHFQLTLVDAADGEALPLTSLSLRSRDYQRKKGPFLAPLDLGGALAAEVSFIFPRAGKYVVDGTLIAAKGRTIVFKCELCVGEVASRCRKVADTCQVAETP